MSGSVSYSCVRNCHRTFAILQNSQAAFWYEEGISKLVSRYDNASMSKVTMWRSRWRCMIKPTYSVSFLLSINIFVWQNVLYVPNDLRILLFTAALKLLSNKIYVPCEVKTYCIFLKVILTCYPPLVGGFSFLRNAHVSMSLFVATGVN